MTSGSLVNYGVAKKFLICGLSYVSGEGYCLRRFRDHLFSTYEKFSEKLTFHF